MKKTGIIAAVICVVCLLVPFYGRGISHGAPHRRQPLALQQAIAAARSNAKPGSSFTVLKEIVATADTRRVGDEALKEAKTHHINLYQKGILADVLRSGGFLLAETEPETRNVIAMHLVSLGSDGLPKDALYATGGGVKLADAQELVKDTSDFAMELYSTPSSEAMPLESRFYGGSFSQCGLSQECTPFAVPRSLLKLGADPNEVREVVALYGNLVLSGFRYAASMPTFAASPLAAIRTGGEKWDALEAEFLRNNHMNPNFDIGLENIRSEEQLRERINLLKRLDKFLEEALKNEAGPALLKANIAVATIPLQVSQGGPFSEDDKTQFGSAIASLLVIYWKRLPTGGFAVTAISESG